MNILELSGDDGSTKLVCKNIIHYFESQGHSVDFICPIKNRSYIKIIFKFILNRPPHDIIHAHLGKASILAQILGKWFNIPVVATLHGFQKAKHYKNIKYFTAVSDAVKDHFVKQGISPNSIQVINNGYEPLPNNNQKFTHNKIDINNKFVIGNVGTFLKVKRHSLLIEAMAKVVKDDPDTILLIAGKGDLEEEINAQIKNLNLENNVFLVGFVEDINSFYNVLDCYVQTSSHEGFCMPILEAMVAEVPVVTTQNLGSDTFVHNNKNAIVTKDNAFSIADNIIKIKNNKDFAREVGLKGHDTVSNMTWDSIAKKYEDYMVNVIRSYKKKH